MSDMTEPLLSVVLCSHNGERTISDQLDALADQTMVDPWELIVVDNRSTDNTAAIAASYANRGIRMRVIDASERAGLSYARNVGAENALAPALAFCDDDDIVGPTWVQAMTDALAEHELVATAIEYDRLNNARLLVGRARFQESGLESLFGLPVVSGACGVTTELWKRLGGNDEELTGTGEDFDFALRAHAAGVQPVFAEDAVYHYRLREEPDAIFGQARAYGSSHAMLWARHGTSRIAPTESLRTAADEWLWVATRAPFALAGRNRSLWMRKAGRRVGRLMGSVQHRVFVP